MEASGAGTDGQGQEAQPNGLVLVCGQFDPLAVVELVERREGELRSEGDREVLNRRTVDEDGLVGFAGLEVGSTFFVKGYSGGRFLEVRAVAQDPAVSVTNFQVPPPPPTLTVGVAGTAVAVDKPAPPATPTEGTGLPDEAVQALEGAGEDQATVDPSGAVEGSVSSSGPGVEDGAAESLTYYLDTAPDAVIDPSIWPLASVRVPVTGDPALAPLYTYAGVGLPEPLEGWEVYTGPTEALPAEADAAGSDAGDGPVADGSPSADVATVESSSGSAAASSSVTVEDPAPPPVQATATPSPGDSPPTSAAGADSSAASVDPSATVDPSAQVTSEPVVASSEPAAAEVEVEQQPAAQDVSADESSQDAAVPSDWDKLVEQANGAGVENASALSDAELRQAITEKNLTPVV